MVEDARKPIAVNIPIQYIFLKDVEEGTGDQDTTAVLWTEMRVTVFPHLFRVHAKIVIGIIPDIGFA